MRIELLDLIQCPICSSQNLEINVVDENDVEIRKGSIICLDCHANYIIQSGIPNLLVNPSKEILDEQEGWTQLEKAVSNTDKLMLSLPDAYGDHQKSWQGQAENFHNIWSKIQLTGNERVLDLGSGRCWSTRFFSKEGCYAVGIDILLTKYVGLLTSDIYIQKEKTYFERILGDMNDMPFRQGVFDIVFVAASLHHSSKIHKTIRFIKHVLKPGGKLIVVNEPVVSIFSNREVKCPEVEHGVNEHVLWLWEYLLALRFSGFRYRLYPFIGSYQKNIDQKNHNLLGKYPSLASKHTIIPPLLYIQLYFFGGILNFIAEIPE